MDQQQEEERDSSLTGSEEPSEVTEEEQSWISWFCSLRGNEFFCEVDEDYIHDEFNLTGLSTEVNFFDYALDTILDVDSPNADDLTEEQQELVDAAAENLYGLIHARYIITSKGLNAMYDKFVDCAFGRCPRVLCEDSPLLPVGRSDLARKHTVSLYCPRCNDVYNPKSTRHSSVDGAYFGTTFPHLFLMTFPAAIPRPPDAAYVPRVFGFRIRRTALPDGSGDIEEAGGAGGDPVAAAAAAVAYADGLGASAVRASGPAGPLPSLADRHAGGGGSVAVAAGGDAAAALRSVGGTGGASASGAHAAARAGGGGGGGGGASGPYNTSFPDAVPSRIREVATVLPRETAQARRRAGQDDFFDASELDDDNAAAAAAAAAAGGGGGAVEPPHHPARHVGGSGGPASAAPQHQHQLHGDLVDDDEEEDGVADGGGSDGGGGNVGFVDILSADRSRARAVPGAPLPHPPPPGARGSAAGGGGVGQRQGGGAALPTLTGPPAAGGALSAKPAGGGGR